MDALRVKRQLRQGGAFPLRSAHRATVNSMLLVQPPRRVADMTWTLLGVAQARLQI
jgi:hypothetical protein